VFDINRPPDAQLFLLTAFSKQIRYFFLKKKKPSKKNLKKEGKEKILISSKKTIKKPTSSGYTASDELKKYSASSDSFISVFIYKSFAAEF